MSLDREETISNERTPLVGSSSKSKSITRLVRPLLSRAQSSLTSLRVPQTHDPKLVLWSLVALIFVFMIGGYFVMIPIQRIYEDIICHDYYDGLKEHAGHIGLEEDIPERFCKGNEVQEELAFVIGVSDFVTCIPGILFAYPYGKLADRWGRKPIFGLGAFGIIFTQILITIICWFPQIFPLRLIWITSIFQVVGGGQTVLTNVVYATLSDISTDETRSNNFFAMGTGGLLAEIVAPSIVAWLMKRSPWIPALAGIVIMILASTMMIFIPETLKTHSDHGHITQNTPPQTPALAPQQRSGVGKSRFKSNVYGPISARINAFQEEMSVFNSAPLIILLVSSLVQPLYGSLVLFVTRYVSKRFGWSLGDTGYIISYRAIINVILLLVILPCTSHILTLKSSARASSRRWYHKFELGLSTKAKDLMLARTSLFFLISGAFLIGASPTIGSVVFALTIWTLGTGFSSACRSLATMLVDQEHVGRLYAAISLVETFGLLGASPLFTALYSWGLARSGHGHSDAWLGLPFYGVAISCVLFGLGVCFLRLPEEKSDEESVDENAPLFGA